MVDIRIRLNQINADSIATSVFASKTEVNSVQANVTAANTFVNANDYATLLTARSNDWATLLSAQANDFNSFTTLTANIYNTFAYLDSNTNPAGSDQQVQFNNNGSFGANSSLIFDGATLKAPMFEATQSSGDEGGELKLNKPATNTTINNGITIDVFQDRVRLFETGGTNRGGYWDITALSAGVGTNLLSGGGGGDVANAWVNANDYSTLLSAYSNDGATLLTARSNDWTTLLTAQANDGATLLTARANDYNTLLTAQANDYNSYTTLNSRIDTVQSNVSSSSSNTNIYSGDTLYSNTSIFLEAGDGVRITGNTTSKTLSFAVQMGNVTSQVISLSGTSNSFTISKAAANSNMMLVFYNGLAQDPTEYTVSGTTLALNNTDPVISGSKLEIRHFDFFSLPGATSSGGGGASFQGSVSGYTSGGGSPTVNTVDKFPFSSDANASDVGDLTVARRSSSGQSSSTSGYTSGGINSGYYNTIDKFPFAANANATDVGDLLTSGGYLSGHSSTTSGYIAGGQPGLTNVIQKFSFTADGNASDVGDLTQGRYALAGQSSTVSGYASGGRTSVYVNTVDKFPFASNANATDVGDVTVARGFVSGQSSASSGYTSGGYGTSIPVTNIIDKSPFASDTNSTDVGDLSITKGFSAGQSSTISGYTSGGIWPSVSPATHNIIDKFPFASDGNATDVGDLTQARARPTGQQV